MQCMDKDCGDFGVDHVHYCDECFEEVDDCICETCYFCELKSVLCRECKFEGEDICDSCCEGHDDDYDEEDESDEDKDDDEDEEKVERYYDKDQLLLPFMNEDPYRTYRVNDIVGVIENYVDSESRVVAIEVGSYVLITEILELGEGLSEDERIYKVEVVAPLARPAVYHQLTRKYLGDIMPF